MMWKQIDHSNEERATRVILLAEDDTEMRTLLSQALRQQGYVVAECSDGGQLISRLERLINCCDPVEYDLIISDIRMPGITGMEVVEGLVTNENCPPIILITAFGDAETHRRARELGVHRIFDKPFEISALLLAIRDVIAPPSNGAR